MEINIDEVLNFNPKSKCKITFTFTEEWKHCYYQWKNKDAPEVDPNDLPVLDDEYLGDTGEPLYNDEDQEVFDPTQEIQYETFMAFSQKDISESDTLISLIQNRVKELIDSGELDEDFEGYEFSEAIDVQESGPDTIASFMHEIGCKDETTIESYNEYDDLLWCTSSQLDEESWEIHIEEVKDDDSENNVSSDEKESLEGKAVVISGVFEKYSRKELKSIVEKGGGKNTSSISKNTSLILAGDKMGPSKKEKAIELNIEMIGEEEFIKRFVNET